MKRNLILGGITLLLLALGILGCIFLQQRQEGTIAVIRQDGKEIQRIDLSKVTESYTIPLHGAQGEENVILVEPGAISMQTANCPDGLCLEMGALTSKGLPIVCLPNHIIIEIIGENETDPKYDIRTY